MKIIETTVESSSGPAPLWVVDTWEKLGLPHGFAGRAFNVVGGGEFNSLFSKGTIALLQQHHSKTIIHLKPPLEHAGLEEMKAHPPAGDAFVADYRDGTLNELAIGIKTADCFPVLVRSTSTAVVAGAHCGWRGAESGLLLDTLVYLGRMGVPARTLEVAIGPGAQACCYEIGPDVKQLLNRAFTMVEPMSMEPVGPAVVTRDGKLFGNIRDLLRAQAMFFGVPEKSITFSSVCTICDQRLFSFRREKEASGRQLSFIGSAS